MTMRAAAERPAVGPIFSAWLSLASLLKEAVLLLDANLFPAFTGPMPDSAMHPPFNKTDGKTAGAVSSPGD